MARLPEHRIELADTCEHVEVRRQISGDPPIATDRRITSRRCQALSERIAQERSYTRIAREVQARCMRYSPGNFRVETKSYNGVMLFELRGD